MLKIVFVGANKGCDGKGFTRRETKGHAVYLHRNFIALGKLGIRVPTNSATFRAFSSSRLAAKRGIGAQF